MRYIIIAVLCLIFVVTIHRIINDSVSECFDDYNFDDLDGMNGTDNMNNMNNMNYLDNIVKENGISGRNDKKLNTNEVLTESVKGGTARFKITNPESVIYLYKLLYILDKVFHQNNIEYWMEGGTMLGAVRHKGIIPWDDDGDVQIWKKDENKFKQLKSIFASYDMIIMPTWFGYKIFFSYGRSIKGFEWLYPAIDIFIMEDKNGKVVYSYPKAQKVFGKCYFETASMYPLERYRFGSFELTGVSRKAFKKYFDTCYGSDWSTHAYEMYDHENEKSIKHVKVLLNDDEKRPAQPILINFNDY